MQQDLSKIENQIRKIQQDLQTIGEMRPGSLTQQYISSKEKRGAYYQISYTYNMKSRTDYVRKEFVNDLKLQIKNYKRFKRLTKRWIDLALKHSKMKIELAIKNR